MAPVTRHGNVSRALLQRCKWLPKIDLRGRGVLHFVRVSRTEILNGHDKETDGTI